MNAIAALLERAKAQVATIADATSDTSPAPPIEAFPEGAWVEFAFAGDSTFGRVEFVEIDGDMEWIHWRDGFGHAHASPPSSLICHWRPTK